MMLNYFQLHIPEKLKVEFVNLVVYIALQIFQFFLMLSTFYSPLDKTMILIGKPKTIFFCLPVLLIVPER